MAGEPDKSENFSHNRDSTSIPNMYLSRLEAFVFLVAFEFLER